jgi:hypothetical protein
MKIRILAIIVLLGACKPAPQQADKPQDLRPADMAWGANFGATLFKNAEVLDVGEVLELAPSDIVDEHIARVSQEWVYDFDLLNGGPARAIKSGVVSPGEPRFIVSNGTLTAIRGDGKIAILNAENLVVAEFEAKSVAWARGASEQAAMAWDGDALWVLGADSVLRWKNGEPAKLLPHDYVIRRVAFHSGSMSFEHGGGWAVVWADGSREVPGAGEFTYVWMNPAKTQIWCKSADNVSFATLDGTENLTFYQADTLKDADSIFVRDDNMLAQWWPSEALWLSDYAKAAWLKPDGQPDEPFVWGASWPQTVEKDGALEGLGASPTAIWTHAGKMPTETKITLNSAASGGVFFDGKTIVRRVGNILQRLGTEQPSKVFDLRVIRQIMCSGDTCLALGREGALDRIDLKSRTRETILFVHTGETLPPVLAFTKTATVLCEPRCITKTGDFASGLVELNVQTGAVTAQPNQESLAKGVMAQRVFSHPAGVQIAISEMERAPHKLGRPPRFFQIELQGFKDGTITPSEWTLADDKHAYFATTKTLESRGESNFAVEIMDAHNLVGVTGENGSTLMHLQGRGPSAKLFIRDSKTGAVISEHPAPNISAFDMVDGRIFYALDDGRLVLADL